MTAPARRTVPFKALLFAALVGLAAVALLMRSLETGKATEVTTLELGATESRAGTANDSLAPPDMVDDSKERVDDLLASDGDAAELSVTTDAQPAHQEIFGRTGRTAKECLEALERRYEWFKKESDPDDFEFQGDEPEHGYWLCAAAVESIMLVQGRAQFDSDPELEGYNIAAEPGFRCFSASSAKYHFPDGEFPIYDAISDRMHKAKVEQQEVPPLTTEQLADLEALYQSAHQALMAYQ
jgi:hypothetical protein